MRKALLIGLLFTACAGPVDPAAVCAAQCSGCCVDGVCKSGDTADACGTAGNACDVCVGEQVCGGDGHCATPMSGNGGGGGGGTSSTGGGGGGGMGCTPQTDAELCAGQACGPLSATDRCGNARNVISCGSCPSGEVCSASGTCLCQPETNSAMCTRLGKHCGQITAADNCGAMRTLSCGTCGANETCGGAGVPNQCGCTPETDAQFCARGGLSCEGATGTDNCGHMRTVASCGTCVSPNTCNAGTCSCPGEDDYSFCSRLGASCGPVSGTDLCGQTRNVASCGTCYGNQTCGGGGTPGVCACAPQSDADLCAAKGFNCGTAHAYDNCGTYRTVSCGTCGGLQTCGGGSSANVCGCTAETNSAFCTRVGAQCGGVTAPDNCGTSRTVASCGTCSSPQTCSASNQCACVSESDAQLCASVGKTCGAITATDNCGTSRSVASCGTCSGGAQCGAYSNVCVAPTPLPSSGVCTANGFCWEVPRGNGAVLNAVWVDSSNVAWAAGEKGTVVRWDGTTPRGWRELRDLSFNAIWASGSGEVWVAGDQGTVLRWNGTVWDDVSPGVTKSLRTLWGDGLGHVYVGGLDDTVRMFSNGTWTTPFHLPNIYTDAVSFIGWGSGLRVLTSGALYQWDGVSASLTVIDDSSCTYTSQVQVASDQEWFATYCYSSYYSTDLQQPYKTIGTTVSPATLPNNQGYGDTHFASRSANEVWLAGGTTRAWKFDGLTWTSATIDTVAHGINAGHGNPARAVFVGSEGAMYATTGSGWQAAVPDAGLPSNVATPYRQLVTPISDHRAVVLMEQDNYPAANTLSLSVWDEGGWIGTTTVPYDLVSAFSPDGTTAYGLVTSTASLYKFNGSTWSSAGTLPTSPYSYASLAGTSATDIWVSGYGTMVHYNGSAFTAQPTPYSGTQTLLDRLVALSPTLAFARADDGQLLKWDGTSWTIDSSIGEAPIDQPMLKTSTSSVWAITASGPRRYAQGAWVLHALPAGETVGQQLYGTSDNDLTVSTLSGDACTWNGSAWSCAAMPPGFFNDQRVVKTGARTWLLADLIDGSGTYRVMIMRK